MSAKYRVAHLPYAGRWVGTGVLLAAIAACSPPPQGNEMQWARTALERNPQLEVVASDANEGVFTVRIRSTGEVQVVSLAELAAAPVAQIEALAIARAETAKPAEQSTAAAERPPAQPEPEQEPEPRRAAEAAPAEPTPPAYTIERTGDQVRVSGPGVSIVSSGAAATAQAGESQRSTDPIICEGRRMLHLDSRNFHVDGDAVTARGGCELHITNSRISAGGTGVVVQDAVVYISNSVIEGSAASFSAGDNARVYLRASTFQGLPRRAEKAVVQDQGGNQWR